MISRPLAIAFVCAFPFLAPAPAAAQLFAAPVRVQQMSEPATALNQHVLIGENSQITPEFLAKHHHQSNGGRWGDNAVVADLWYDATHRRLVSRSVQLYDVDDPADVRLGRAAGRFPNELSFRRTLDPGTIVGHVGFVGWSRNGFGAYQTAVQGAVIDDTRGMLYLSAAPGVPGRTRAGSTYEANELVQHVAMMPDGAVVFGYNTDPAQTPETLVTIRGNLRVEGTVYAARCVEVETPAGR